MTACTRTLRSEPRGSALERACELAIASVTALAVAAAFSSPAAAQDEDVIGSVFVRTSLGDFEVDLKEDHSVVREYARAFADLVRDRIFFHKSDKQIGCDPDGDGESQDPNCFRCVCVPNAPVELNCLGEVVGSCLADPNERSCTQDGFLLANPLEPSRVVHAGRFQLDENNQLQETSDPLDVVDPTRAGIFENNPFTVAFVRNGAGVLTEEWVINLADNSELFDDAAGSGASAYMVIGSISDDTGALAALAALPTSDARCNPTLDPPVTPTPCDALADPGSYSCLLAELGQLPVIDPARVEDPNAPPSGEPYLITLCDPSEPDDSVCRMPVCETVSDNGVECTDPLCYAVTLQDDDVTYTCDFPVTPNFPILESAEPAGLLLVNNGLAPPEPTNFVDFANNPQLTVDVRDEGCGSEDDPLASCDDPGTPTFLELASGGSISRIRVSDGSRLIQSSGEIGLGLELYDAARARLEGGDVAPIQGFGSSDLALAGGNVSSLGLDDSATALLTGATAAPLDLTLSGTSFLRVAGSDFLVDGSPVATLPASLSVLTGDLTGNLASGEPLDASFDRADTAELHLLDAATLEARRAFVQVSGAGNAADDTGFGAVSVPYSIGQAEVTNGEYAAFLNSVALEDPNGLWDSEMAGDPRGGITRSGAFGNYLYTVPSGRGDWPVVFVSRFDAMRYANWLHNGRPLGDQDDGTTETGAYTFVDGVLDEAAGRSADARFFLPTRDEWYKAAYYDRASQSYFDYPTSSDNEPANPIPARELGNAANTSSALGNDDAPLSDAGAYAFSASPNGTLDQAGNVLEWLEDSTALFGSHWDASAALAASSAVIDVGDPASQEDFLGFRVPEPSAAALAATALATLAVLHRRYRLR